MKTNKRFLIFLVIFILCGMKIWAESYITASAYLGNDKMSDEEFSSWAYATALEQAEDLSSYFYEYDIRADRLLDDEVSLACSRLDSYHPEKGDIFQINICRDDIIFFWVYVYTKKRGYLSSVYRIK